MHSFKSNRGSILLVAMIFSLSIAIFLGSYMNLAGQSMKLSNRSFYSNAAMNLVDTGLEEGLWALNNSTWAGFSSYNTNQYQGTFPSSSTYYNLAGGVKGQVKVWINSNSTPAQAVAKAIITLSDGSQIIKEAEMYMTHASYFKNGLVAKNTISFKGNNATVDGWNSNPNGTVIPYSSSVANAQGQVGSTSVQIDSISVSNANIYGYAEVGGSSSSDIQVGPQGSVGPYGQANGTINPAYVSYDFTTSFPDATAPSPSSPITLATVANVTLPRAGDTGVTVGTTTTYYYNVPRISLSGNSDMLTIGATSSSLVNIVIMTTNTTGTTIDATGNHSGINISPGSTLAIYTAGDVSITGNGILNGTAASANQPSSFALYGTRTSAGVQTSGEQNIAIKGNGSLSGVIYAPNSDLTINGNGDVLGSVVANSVSLTGNANFHYDESLKTSSTSNLWSLSKWHELYAASDRATYAGQLNF